MWRDAKTPDPVFSDTLALDLADVQPSLAGPKRPQDRVTLDTSKVDFEGAMEKEFRKAAEIGQARPRRRRQFRSRPRRRRHRRHHLLHEHLEPERDDRRRPPRPQRGQEGPQDKALGQDLPRAGLADRRRVFREGGAAGRSRRPRFQSRRLRLHHLHRQFRAAAGERLEGDQRQRSRRRVGALRKPQLRGPRQSGRARELSRLAAPRRRLRARRLDVRRSDAGAPGHRQRRQAGLSQGHLALLRRSAGVHRPHHHPRIVREALCGRVHGRCELEGGDGRARPHLRVGHRFDLRAEPALFRGHDEGAEAGHGHRERAHPRPLPRFDHDGPHLPGRQHPRGLARPDNISWSTRSASRISTSTARGAAITR